MITSQLETPEVNLYYTVRGSGPILPILQGGSGNAEGSEALANQLADHFTVATYDRRGLSRSTPIQSERYELGSHADDAARLIAALSQEPAFVFGSSMGALIGVELAAKHRDLVRLLIAHEPPLYRLLQGAERDEALRSRTELVKVFQREGTPAAMKLMIAHSGVDFNDREPEVSLPTAPTGDPKSAARRAADLKHFLTSDIPAVTRYVPDIDALTRAGSKIVAAIGETSPPTFPYQSAVALAALLGQEATVFRGGHTGYILRPKAFAAKLDELFQREEP
jgi:pimeloyl-ACP methyl ester carboxylesterase